ncbi:MAG TPA: radical SAM protein [Phycisphaerales bacterium]|nr:radical SAM protein [Phycisphaerales bacterium]
MKETSFANRGHIFGPVPSRRLGRSLGIDLVPPKTCTYDCLYCQVGLTTEKTTQRKCWIPVEKIIDELKEKLSTKPDCITLSGAGEPTLYSECGRLIDEIKKITSIPVAVITNGSLLFMPEIRQELHNADMVLPSLCAGDEQIFQKIHRHATDIKFSKMLQGLIDFRKEYKGKYWLEVFLIAGLNDSDEQIEKIAQCIKKINPDKVQLNTVSRPPVEKVAALSQQRLEQIAKMIGENAEVIADFKTSAADGSTAKAEDVLEMLKRHPCSADEIAGGMKISKLEILKLIDELIKSAKIEPVEQNNKTCYRVK